MKNPLPYIPLNEEEKREMLRVIGVRSFDELFSAIPAEWQTDDFDLSPRKSELEVEAEVSRLSKTMGRDLVIFCGAGYYDHYIPKVVDALASRSEFYTAYTPYQAEASQGTLQAIYEYQTDIARLTGMEVANASLYDGATALFEAATMAMRITGRRRILVDGCVNPIHRAVLRTHLRNLDLEYVELPAVGGWIDSNAVAQHLSTDVAAVLLQTPNFFGCIGDYSDLIALAHAKGALAVVSVYPISLGVLKSPGAMGADIVVGEGQSLGLPLSFGGPYLGFMATRREYIRQMPGRLVGATTDRSGRRGFVLTLQAREQHIRREKATSNICTNEALCALRAHIYLTLLGKYGLPELARLCASRAAYALERLTAVPGVRGKFAHPFFNEFVIDLSKPAALVVEHLLEQGIVAGVPLGQYYPQWPNSLLVAVTEKRTIAEIDRFVTLLAETLGEV